ncbi:MAG: hypothetical protein KC425_00715 [Anaerolineales bacterium]|nr:hypothetical protein [Anaerolineales bacterium]
MIPFDSTAPPRFQVAFFCPETAVMHAAAQPTTPHRQVPITTPPHLRTASATHLTEPQ